MLTQTAAQLQAMRGNGVAEHVRVSVQDAGGTWRELTSYGGVNFIDSVTWSENVDDPGATAEVILRREHEKFSLAPLMLTSPMNIGLVPGGAYVPLLSLNRDVRVEVAIVPMGSTPVDANFFRVFSGVIDTVDSAAGDSQIRITCRDYSGRLMDSFIEDERLYAYAAVSGTPVGLRQWAPVTAYTVGQYVVPTEGKLSGYFYRCTVAGTTGLDGTEPTWPITGTVVSGTATFTTEATTSVAGFSVESIIQAILTDNSAGYTLAVVGSPSWLVGRFKQARMGVFEAVRALALQMGWDVRFRHVAGVPTLTLYEPQRTKSVADFTFLLGDYTSIGSFSVSGDSIRNVVRIIFPDLANLAPGTSHPLPTIITVTDATSVTKYGRRYMEIQEGQTSHINTVTTATRLVNAALADLKDPIAEQSVELALGFPWVEVGDLYAFGGNSVHFSGTQNLAVQGYSHTAESGCITTSLTLRGKPALGVDRWLEMESLKGPGIQLFENGGTFIVSVTSLPGGLRLAIAFVAAVFSRDVEWEYHLSSTSSSYAASAATMKAVSQATTQEFTDLLPGITYFCTVVPRIRSEGMVSRGQQCALVSGVAGRNATGHLLPGVDFGRQPLNGDFETQLDVLGMPDHWSIVAGTLGVNVSPIVASDGASGSRYMRLAGAATTIRSAMVPVCEGLEYVASIWARYVGGSPFGSLYEIRLWDQAGVQVLSYGDALYLEPAVWVQSVHQFVVPVGARFVSVDLAENASGDSVDVDNVLVMPAPAGTLLTYGAATLSGGGYLAPGYGVTAVAGAVKTRIPNRGRPGRVHVRAQVAGTGVFEFRVWFSSLDGSTVSSRTLTLASGATSEEMDTGNSYVLDQSEVWVTWSQTGAGSLPTGIVVTFEMLPPP